MRQFDNLATPGASLRAADLNELHKEIKRGNQLSVEGGSLTQGPSGPTISVDKGQSFYAAITAVGTNGFHSWEERRIDLKGGWLIPPNPRRGGWNGEAAKEMNGGSASIGSVVQLQPAGNYVSVSGKREKIWLFSAGGTSTKTFIRPYRWATLEAKNKAGIKSYARAVVWSENGLPPDEYDVPVFIEGYLFPILISQDYARVDDNIPSNSYYCQSRYFTIESVDGVTNYPPKSIENAPIATYYDMCQYQFEVSSFDIGEIPIYEYTYDNNYDPTDLPKNFMFTRRILKNKDGTDKAVPVRYINKDLVKTITPFPSFDWRIEPYFDYTKYLNQYGYNYGGQGRIIKKTFVSYTQYIKPFKAVAWDPFNMGYPSSSSNSGAVASHLFSPMASSSGSRYSRIVAIQTLHANSPFHPVATTSTLGGSIGTPISGGGTTGPTPIAPV